MTTYRPRATVEAIQWTGDNINEIWDAFTCAHIYGPTPEKNPDWLIVTTVRGEVRADIGDWIVRGITGLLMVCREADFDAIYEAVTAVPSGTEEN
jgi:hypothetical protein